MPLNPEIALQFKNPQIVNPLDGIGKLMQVKGQMSENLVRQAQLDREKSLTDAENLQNEARRRDAASSAKLQEVLMNPESHAAFAQGDFSPIWKAGISPNVAKPAIDTINAANEKALTLTKDKAAIAAQGRQQLQAVIEGLHPTDDNIAAQNFNGAIPLLAKDHPELAAQLSTVSAGPQFRQQIQQIAAQNGLAQAILDNHLKTQESQADLVGKKAKEDREAAAFATDHPVKAAVAEATMQDPNLLTPEQRATNTRAQAIADQTKANQDSQRALELKRIGVEQGNLSERIRENKLKSGGSMAMLSDSQKSIAQKIANGDINFEQLGRNYPDKEALMAGAIELNPDLSRNTAATKKAFSDPASKQSQNLGTISRIVGHIGRFEENSDKLGVSPSMLLGTSLTGDAAAVSNDAHAIAGELEKLVSGGVGSVGQIKAWQEELKSSRPGIRKAAIDEISQLIGSQYEGMQQTYKSGTGQDLPIDKYVSPEGRKWLQKNGIAVGPSQQQNQNRKPLADIFR